MKTYSFTTRQMVAVPLEEVFAFFSKPENLKILTPEGLGFQILTPGEIVMREGAIIDYRIRMAGIPLRWTSRISVYDPPGRFADVQLRGPYLFWQHTHTFTALPGGTLLEDEVQYILPFGILGRIIHYLFVRRKLEHIFSFRALTIERLFSGDSTPGMRKHSVDLQQEFA